MKKSIIGISSFVHDTSACLVDSSNGKVIYASAEERFSNLKSDFHIPFFAIKECLKIAKKNNYIIDKAAVAFDPKYFLGDNFFKKINFFFNNSHETNKFIKYLQNFEETFFNLKFNYSFVDDFFFLNSIVISKNNKKKLFEYLTYHFNSMIKYKKVNKILNEFLPNIKITNVRHHVAHAVSSYFNSGFKDSNIIVIDGQGEEDTITIYKAKKNSLELISKTTWPISIGYFYQIATFALNYKIGDEYKVMGMSAYGNNKYVKYFKKYFALKKDGTIILHKNPYIKIVYHKDTKYEKLEFTKKFYKLFKKPHVNNLDQNHFDFAKSIQTVIEFLGLKLANWSYQKNKSKNLCISGGVALNGLMNNKILSKSMYKNIYVYAASGDDGTSVGAAQYLFMNYNHFKNRKKIDQVFFGYNDNKIFNRHYVKKKIGNKLDIVPCKNVFKFIAKELSRNKVVAVYNGKSEFGPRALGSRSIIANALDKNIQKNLNLKIKLREPFRPFAPIVLEKDCKKFFRINSSSEFMLFICDTVKKFRKFIPGVIHKDNTARVQTVNKKNKIFFGILTEFKKITNIPILINTSFNIGGEAMVNSFDEAINSFNQMDIDYLLIGNFVVKKKSYLKKKSIFKFIQNRKNNFKKINPYPRIDLLRLNANFYIKSSRIVIEIIKDYLKIKLKKKYFIR
jgi:carbamoyltransferase